MALITHSIPIWREKISRRLLNLDFQPLSDEPFCGWINPILTYGEVHVVRWAHTPGVTFRDEQLVKDGANSVGLVYSPKNSFDFKHQGRDGSVSTREATLMHNGEIGELGSYKTASYVAVVLPQTELKICSENRDKLIAKRWRRTSNALRMLMTYVSCLEKNPANTGEEVAAAASRYICDLVRLAAGEQVEVQSESAAESVSAVRLEIALAWINERFRDPALSEASVAASQGISTRYLQQLLARGAIRFTEHVNELRLREAHTELINPCYSSRSITEIALTVGFSDISHFNRLFRQRFGSTPSALRAESTRPYKWGRDS